MGSLGCLRGPAWVQPCSALILPSFLCPQVDGSGEEQLCADFPELDLSQLDAGDFDSATCFGELQWCPENGETEPGQYSPDDSELFQVHSPGLATCYPTCFPLSLKSGSARLRLLLSLVLRRLLTHPAQGTLLPFA